jgi:flagellin
VTGSDTLNFAITSGVSNSDSTLKITESDVTYVLADDDDGDGITGNEEVWDGSAWQTAGSLNTLTSATATAAFLSSVNMTASSSVTYAENIGGGTSPTEEVRYVSEIDISTHASALLAMTVVDAALETVAANRATLGAVANRLESTIQNLMTTSENTAASLSRVMDADYAAESSALARAQVLQQASIAILAQANATAQQVLRLLE